MPSFPFACSAEALFAAEAAREAGLLTARLQRALPPSLTKADRSPVTVADFAAQAVVAARLAEAFPGEPLVAEETAAVLRSPEHAETAAGVLAAVRSAFPQAALDDVLAWLDRGMGEAAPRFWVLDPIDGTKGFLRGGQFAVALALVENGAVQVGALACPQLPWPAGEGRGVLALAVRGGGAWWASLDDADAPWQPLAVSPETDPRRARLLRSYESSHTNPAQIAAFTQALGSEAEPVRMDSQAKYAVLAAGGAEVYLRVPPADHPNYRENIWDQAAGALIVAEAGGQVTDLDGKPLDFSRGRMLAENRGVLATNGHLHAAALTALRAARV